MTKYFVSPSGNDTNDGLSYATAFATLRKASQIVLAGDEVEVGGGWYPGQLAASFNNLVGTAAAPTKIYAQGGTEPLFEYADASYGISVNNCQHISFYGLTLLGNAKNLTYEGAYAKKDEFDAKYSAGGFTIRDSFYVTVKACVVRDFPGHGIFFGKCDYVKCNNNDVSGCTKYTPFGTQGITFLYAVNAPGAVAGAERLTANYNHSYDNINLIPWSAALGGTDTINEGAGIYNDTTKDDNNGVPYTGAARFAYNVCTYNGGAGIHVLKACPTKVEYNFVNANQRSFTDRGEVNINTAVGSELKNNQIGTDSDRQWFRIGNTPGVVVTGNTVRGTTLSSIFNSAGSNVSGNTFL